MPGLNLQIRMNNMAGEENKQQSYKKGLQKTLLTEIKIKWLNHYRHIKRHSSILKDVLEGKVERKCISGRQCYM